ncbi:MAG: exopolysaccharide transport family protein [Xanthobacteraceae bacterium]
MRRDAIDGGAARGLDAADGQLDLAALGRALWRRKRWIIIPTILAALAAGAFVNFVTPMYRSEALVLIDDRETAYNRPQGGDRQAERERPLLDAEAVQSQVQLALSRDLARAVVRDLKLGERPEFKPEANKSLVSAILSLTGLARDPSRMTFEERMLERYYERLSIYSVDRSRVITIDFSSENPILAAEVANAVAERLLTFQQVAKQDAMRQASHWLAGEIKQLRARVAEAEGRAEEFRGKSNLYLGNNNNSLSGQQLGEANSQLVLARTQRAEAESKAKLIREMLRTGRPIEASDIVNSELIRRLNEQRVTLRAQLAEQSSTLLDQHPRIKELKAQIADLESQTRVEAEKLVRSLESDAKIAGGRVETLIANLDQMKKQASALGVEDVQLRALEREAKSQRDLLESYLSRYRDVTSREGPDAVPPDARIVSRAVPAPTPYFPKKLPIVLIAAFATMTCAMTFIALGELMSGDLQRYSAAPMREAMPAELSSNTPPSWIGKASEAPPGRAEPPGKSRGRQMSMLADHVRVLGRGIVLVTSADDGESAPALAIELAREIARDGKRVLLLDLDVGAAPAGRLVADPRVPGLADLLFGVATFSEVIQRDRASRIHVITVGRGIRDTAALLAGEKLSIVLGALSQTYEHVIVAAPALALIPGAARLARFSRGLLLVAVEGGEGVGAAASDALAAKGFANVAVVSLAPEAAPPGTSPERAAA